MAPRGQHTKLVPLVLQLQSRPAGTQTDVDSERMDSSHPTLAEESTGQVESSSSQSEPELRPERKVRSLVCCGHPETGSPQWKVHPLFRRQKRVRNLVSERALRFRSVRHGRGSGLTSHFFRQTRRRSSYACSTTAASRRSSVLCCPSSRMRSGTATCPPHDRGRFPGTAGTDRP